MEGLNDYQRKTIIIGKNVVLALEQADIQPVEIEGKSRGIHCHVRNTKGTQGV